MLDKIYRKSVKWSLKGSLATAIFQLAQMAVFARLAGPVASGDYALAAAVIGFLTPIAEAGLSQAIVQSEKVHRRQLIRLAKINLALGVFIFSGLWFIGSSMARWYSSEGLPALLLVMGSSLLFTPLGAQGSALLARDMQFDVLAKIEATAWVLSFAFTTVMAYFGWGAMAMAVGFFIRNLVATLGSMLFSPKLPDNETDSAEIAEHIRFGFFDLSGRWAEFLANYLDKLIVGKWLGVEALGYYNLAFTFLMLPTARIGYVVTRVTFPLYSRIRGQKETLQLFFEQSAKEITLVLFPIYLALALFAQEITFLLFGEHWLPVVPLFEVFGIAGLVRTLCAPFPQLLRGLGKPQLWLLWLLTFTSVLNAVLFVFLWRNPSALMAAESRTFVKFFIEIPLLWWLARRVGLQFIPVLNFAGKYLLLLIPIAGATWVAGLVFHNFSYSMLFKSIVFGAGLLFLAWKRPLLEMRVIFEQWGFRKSSAVSQHREKDSNA